MLKKLGIVAAATTAAVLAISPLAFAGDDDDHHKKDGDDNGRHHSRSVEGDCNIAQRTGDSRALGIIALSDVISDLNVAVPICDNNVNVQVIPIGSPNAQEID